MNARATLVSLAVSLVAFLVVGGTVTELLVERVWPSLFVGLPAGALAGVVAFVLTARALRSRRGR